VPALPPALEPVEGPRSANNSKADRFAGIIALAVVFAAPAFLCVRAACAYDPDIWWHLRTGEWIFQHHSVPRVDIFSGANAGKPWEAYSWLFELLVFRLFRGFGLAGVVGYSAAMVMAITIALWHLIKRNQSDFTIVALLVFGVCSSMTHLYTPRPWLFTILFFAIEIDILMQARKTGRTHELAWLPLIFALWSNIHIQFIDGLLVLGLAVVETIAASRGIGPKTLLRVPVVFATLAASVLATLLNPFGWRIYKVAFDLASQSGVMDKIGELKAIAFRDYIDFTVLFLAIAATAAVAWRRKVQLFEAGLLVFALAVSFRSQRDVWVVAVTAAAILASTIPGKRSAVVLPRFATQFAMVIAFMAMLVSFRLMKVNNETLAEPIEKVFPVDAVNTVRAKGYSGPLYNDFNWGGYLIWSLRMPVSIDGRAALYGDKAIDRSLATWNAEPDWASDPALASAGIVIGPVKAPLFQVLKTDPRFKLAYEDKMAAVYVARR